MKNKLPRILDEEKYPTEEYLKMIKDYTPEMMPIMEFITTVIQPGWHYGDWGFKLKRKYKGIRKFELHTGGWSGNEEIISVIKENLYLTYGKMKYVQWHIGGHFYFEIKID